MKTIKEFKKEINEEENIFNTLDAGSQSRVRKDYERVTKGERLVIIDVLKARLEQSEEVLKLINEIKNPYPEDIFPEIHEELFEEINQELQNKFEFPLDKLSASLMRKARENLKKELKDAIKGVGE